MKIGIAILSFSLSIIMISSCAKSSFNSMALIGRDKAEVKSYFGISNNNIEEGYSIYEGTDTFIVVSQLNNYPFEGMFLFQNGLCYYERLNVYCSPCADEMVDAIVADKNYMFSAIDPVNYLSDNNTRVSLRLKQKLTAEGNCNEITLIDLTEINQ